MPLKLRRTLSMEDLQNASDDEMDVLLSSSESPKRGPTKESSQNGNSQRERMFPFSLIAHETAPRPRPKRSGPTIVPVVELPDSDDFFLSGPQAPILKIEGSGGSNRAVANDSSVSSSNAYQSVPRSRSVRFEESDDFEWNEMEKGVGEDHDSIRNVRAQVNEVTQKMKDNIGRLLEREANLDSLMDTSDQLPYSGDIYRQSSEHLRRKLWWRQHKTRLVLTAVFIFCTILVFVPLISRMLR